MQKNFCAPVQKYSINLKLEHTFALLSQQILFYLLKYFEKLKQHMQIYNSIRGYTVKSLPFDSWSSRSYTFTSFFVPPTFKKSNSLFYKNMVGA